MEGARTPKRRVARIAEKEMKRATATRNRREKREEATVVELAARHNIKGRGRSAVQNNTGEE